MVDSILNTTKQVIGIEADDTSFDVDIIMHINSIFATLNQLGLGPEDGFEIADANDEWATYIAGNKKLNSVKSYVYQKTRLMFDPPATSFAIDALKEQIAELEWRLMITVDPLPEGAV